MFYKLNSDICDPLKTTNTISKAYTGRIYPVPSVDFPGLLIR
jgi:hypothetical protein